MALPAGVSTSTVTGTFVNPDGTPLTGFVTFVPAVDYLLDAADDAIIIASKTLVNLDAAGAFSVVLPATDDTTLEPVDWTYEVTVRLGSGNDMLPFSMDLPGGGTVDLADVSPVSTSHGTSETQGPPGPAGPPGPPGSGDGDPGIVISDTEPEDTDVLWADTATEGVGPAMTVAVFTYTDETDVRPEATVVFWIPDPYDLPNPLDAEVGDLVLRTTPDVITSVTGVTNIEHYTVTEYDAIVTPDPDTVYIVVADP